MHTISFLAKVRVMPSKYDPELRSKAVGLAEHRDDYPSKFDALTAAEFPDSDPQDAEYFLLFGKDHGWVFFRALSRLKFNDEPVDDIHCRRHQRRCRTVRIGLHGAVELFRQAI